VRVAPEGSVERIAVRSALRRAESVYERLFGVFQIDFGQSEVRAVLAMRRGVEHARLADSIGHVSQRGRNYL
jgi:hypothetical protein